MFLFVPQLSHHPLQCMAFSGAAGGAAPLLGVGAGNGDVHLLRPSAALAHVGACELENTRQVSIVNDDIVATSSLSAGDLEEQRISVLGYLPDTMTTPLYVIGGIRFR